MSIILILLIFVILGLFDMLKSFLRTETWVGIPILENLLKIKNLPRLVFKRIFHIFDDFLKLGPRSLFASIFVECQDLPKFVK